MIHILWSILVGFLAGLVARALLPGADHMGLLATTALGIVGSVVGGLIGQVFSKPQPGAAFHRAGFILSVAGAIVVLLAWRLLR